MNSCETCKYDDGDLCSNTVICNDHEEWVAKEPMKSCETCAISPHHRACYGCKPTYINWKAKTINTVKVMRIDSVAPEFIPCEPIADKPRSKYHREIKPGVWIDVYDVLEAFSVTNSADAHAIKKLLMPGTRGHKDAVTDRREAIASIERAIELEQVRKS